MSWTASREASTPAMYESDEQRDADIDELATADPADLRDRLLAATTEFADAVAAVDDRPLAAACSRVRRADRRWPAVTIVATRRREVEIHHADLGASYTHHDWPDDFVAELLDVVSVDRADAGPFRLRATDLGRDWAVGGEGGPDGDGSWRRPRLVAHRSQRRATVSPATPAPSRTRPVASAGYQPRVPGSPLNGPTTLSVTQPP